MKTKEKGLQDSIPSLHIHTMTAEGELLIMLPASFAQEESLSASENQKWEIRHAFERGKLQCVTTMFGYHIEKGILTINAQEADIVKEVFERFIAGESCRKTGRDLNNRGVPRPLDGKWGYIIFQNFKILLF